MSEAVRNLRKDLVALRVRVEKLERIREAAKVVSPLSGALLAGMLGRSVPWEQAAIDAFGALRDALDACEQ